MPDISPNTSWVENTTNTSNTWNTYQAIPSNTYTFKQVLIFGSSTSALFTWDAFTSIWGE
tara:strand:+ start:13044 stop:13223 length:180 start_codon:yes stop_codon:yes gene_type:complete